MFQLFGCVIVALSCCDIESSTADLGAATIQYDSMNSIKYIRSIIIKSLDSLEY
jgi:hypothetical protein